MKYMNSSILFRCAEEDKQTIAQAAARLGLSVSDFVRMEALRAAREILK